MPLIRAFLQEGGKIKWHENGVQLDWDGFLWTVAVPKECWPAQFVIFITEGIQEMMLGREKYEHDADCHKCGTVTHHEFYNEGHERDSSNNHKTCLTCKTVT